MCLHVFEGARVLSKIDLKSFFFQIPLHEASRPLTAITTPRGLFQWNVVPQGVKTSPAMAQRFIAWIFSSGGPDDLLTMGCTAFIDDIAVAGAQDSSGPFTATPSR